MSAKKPSERDLREQLNKKKEDKKSCTDKRDKQRKNSKKCHFCGGFHKVRDCRFLLREKNISKRRLMVKRKGLCMNCLMPAQRAHVCTQGPCRVCDGNDFHNSILCFIGNSQ